jgi:dTDP-4-amino-4,6-dideoxygalactose transaminase
MQNLIRLSKSCINEAEKRAVIGVLDREFLGMGAEVQLFEQALTDFFGRPAVCVVNGTAALHLAIQACNIGLGDEVLVPSITYVSSFQAISATGAKPVACDIDQESLILDLKDAEKRLTSNTKAIMPVHYSGGVGRLEEVYFFAKYHGLRVIEDAAHAFGTIYNGQRIGKTGDISCFSFDGIKNITSGEGGCIVTDNKSVLQAVKDARMLGVEKDTEKRYSGQRSWEFEVNNQGWRYHMSNIMAAIGMEQLRVFDHAAEKRKNLAKLYDTLLLGQSDIIPLVRNYEEVVPHIYVVRIPKMKDRKTLQENLLNNNIQTGIHYQPNHWLNLYSDPKAQPLPVTEFVFPQLLTLPLHVDLKFEDIEYITKMLKDELKNIH